MSVDSVQTSRWLLAGSVFAALLFAAAAQAISEEPASATVDEFVNSELRAQHIPGAGLAVVRDGRIIMAAGYGMANVELSVPTKPLENNSLPRPS
jgi:CubicO group peptidase (beta-lactamase class C family)